ncbi:MAG TPA: VOC family protein [Rhizomicrobium sp.]|jgi:catechol 2,3-dioxygenase-like lactoylglutathione lyase family enzyme|nr:VOC family protein [Rhizomicrobium sp.]
MTQGWHLERLYHTVVNARDLDASVAFYRLLGFEVLNDRRHVEWPDFVATIFGMKRAKGAGVLMVLPNDPGGPMIDIIEWKEPRAKFAAVPVSDGEVPRIIAFRVKNVRQAYDDLAAKGVRFTRDLFTHEELGIIGSCCCYDPNGNLIELIELPAGQRHSKANEALLKKA